MGFCVGRSSTLKLEAEAEAEAEAESEAEAEVAIPVCRGKKSRRRVQHPAQRCARCPANGRPDNQLGSALERSRAQPHAQHQPRPSPSPSHRLGLGLQSCGTGTSHTSFPAFLCFVFLCRSQ